MKKCPNCGNEVNEGATFCNVCGFNMATEQNVNNNNQFQQQGMNQQQWNMNQNQQNNYGNYTMDCYDHTMEFDGNDISDNKVIAMLVYLMGTVGIIIALIASSESNYVKFHVRQAMKFLVCKILIGIITVLLIWTFIVPILAGIALLVLQVVKIICFFQICSGKAVEPVIIRNLGFLK